MAAGETREIGDQAAEQAVPRGISRRDVLKMGAAAAAAAGVGYIGVHAATAEGATLAPPDKKPAGAPPGGQAKFKLDIQNCPVASANAVAVSVEDLTVDLREMTTGADWDYRVYAPGDAHYGSVTVTSRVEPNSKELQAWWTECSKGKNIRKSISIIFLDRAGQETRRFNLLECFPTKWDPGDYSPSSTVACETIVCKIGRVELA